MTEFIMLVAAIAVGYLIAGVIMFVFMCNKFVMKKLMEWSYKMTVDVMKDFEENDFMEEKKIEAY